MVGSGTPATIVYGGFYGTVSYYLGCSRTFHAQLLLHSAQSLPRSAQRFCTVHSSTATVLLGSTSADYYAPESPCIR